LFLAVNTREHEIAPLSRRRPLAERLTAANVAAGDA
jgi:hypothetical protein